MLMMGVEMYVYHDCACATLRSAVEAGELHGRDDRGLTTFYQIIKKIVGCRRFNPITTTDGEHRFFSAAEALFFRGWQLGSDPEIQILNSSANHLTTGLLKYIKTTGRFTSGINLFEKLRHRDPEISSLLAQGKASLAF